MSKPVRVRFAPSPTGGLHLGGVRTALFNYLFAKKHNGTFVLRIEDTDQTRFVEGAEQYIIDTLEWCGISPSESPIHGGEFAPYRQSERKDIYKKYALQLVEQGNAYYAFDTTQELEQMRSKYKTEQNPSPQYDCNTRMHMRNSLSLMQEEVDTLLQNNTPYVIRIKMPENETVKFTDMIRGEITNQTSLVDDKVLLKADGMPTYHLAVVVDDYLMKISHAFRGEEWLPSAPVHIMLWEYLGWGDEMPQWAHLPLILKPDGNGKLSKRDGDRLGFPVFAMDWKNAEGELAQGFKEKGFLPEAFVNILAMLGWKENTEQEIFSLEELKQHFDINRVHKAGAKFNYEKALWYNHEWIKKLEANENKNDGTNLLDEVKKVLSRNNISVENDTQLCELINLVKDRCTLLPDFAEQLSYFYISPKTIDTEAIKAKWSDDKKLFFETFINSSANIDTWTSANIEAAFKELATAKNIKAGELQLPLRIMLVGGKFGPNVFTIAEHLGKEETNKRIQSAINLL